MGRKTGGQAAGWHVTVKIFLVTITNPKGVLFLVSLLPPFVSAETGPWQALILVVTFNGLSALNILFWGYLSGSALARFAAWPHVGKVSALILVIAVALTWLLD